MRRLQPIALATFMACAAVACAEQADAADASAGADAKTEAADASPDTDADVGPGFVPDTVGTVNLVMSNFAGPEVGCFAVLSDGPPIPGLELVAEQGDCAVWRRIEAGFCDPPCSDFCAPDGTCVPWPSPRSAGTIEVSGLSGPLAFEPTASGYRTVTSIDGDLFGPGASIGVEAPGDQVPGFSLSAKGVAPFDDAIESITLEDGADALVTWTAASSGRIQLALRLGWHGGPFTDLLLCETDDVGSLVIPGELISQFPYFEGGLFQVPSSMGRFQRDFVATPDGEVELFVGSMVYVDFMHAFPE